MEKKRDPTLRYTLYDDAKECTFRPKINSAPGGKKKGRGKGEEKDGSGEDDGHEAARKQEAESRDAFGFLDRQEAMEREKRRELDETNAKESYEYLKKRGMTKACPKCGAKQSHDEVRRPLLDDPLTHVIN